MPLGNHKLNKSWCTTAYTLETCKIQILPALNTDEDVEQHKCLFLTCENTRWHSHFGRQFDSFL